jgi:ClpP class serine protease
MDRVGSIGVMTNFMSMSRMLKEKLGIDVYEYYARKSTEKNQPTRTLLDEKATPEEKLARENQLLDDLDFTNDIFHAVISENLGIKKDSPVFTGKIFHAEEGIQNGLAHEINTLQYAIEYAHREGLIAKINNYKLNPTKK